MTNIFLRAKHWQLFLLMIGIPLLSKIYMYASIWMVESSSTPEMVTDERGFTQVLDEKFIQFGWFPATMLLFSLLVFGWLWSLAIGLQKWMPAGVKMKTLRFKVFFFIPFIDMLFIINYMTGIFMFNGAVFLMYLGIIDPVMIPLHLFSIFCIFHTLYFAAKTLKTVELKRKVGLGDFIGEFFLLWFYFIGIWIIQPKVNKLYNDNKARLL